MVSVEVQEEFEGSNTHACFSQIQQWRQPVWKLAFGYPVYLFGYPVSPVYLLFFFNILCPFMKINQLQTSNFKPVTKTLIFKHFLELLKFCFIFCHPCHFYWYWQLCNGPVAKEHLTAGMMERCLSCESHSALLSCGVELFYSAIHFPIVSLCLSRSLCSSHSFSVSVCSTFFTLTFCVCVCVCVRVCVCL